MKYSKTMLAVCVISPLLIGGCASTAGNGSSVSLSKAWNGTLDYILGSDDSSESRQRKLAERASQAANGNLSEETLTKEVLEKSADKIALATAQRFDREIPNSSTEISVSGVSTGKPDFEILNIIGFGQSENGHIQNFVQSSAIGTGGRTTLNLGLGRRYLSADEQFIYGINTFFDIDPRYNHQRASVGFEVKGNALELTANSYHGLSDWKTGKDGNTERALGGHDIELGAQVPYIPAAKIYFKQFKWELFDATALKGKTYSLEFAQIFDSGLGVELGRRNFDGSETDESFAKLTYRLPLGKAPAPTGKRLFSSRAFEQKSMKQDMLKKVRRHNAMVVQTKFTSGVGGI